MMGGSSGLYKCTLIKNTPKHNSSRAQINLHFAILRGTYKLQFSENRKIEYVCVPVVMKHITAVVGTV